MRVFVAGATGVLGSRIVPLLVAAGHTVAGMTRSASKANLLRTMGAEPVVCDAYDREGVVQAVAVFAPDLVLHELTDLPDTLEELPANRDANARMRLAGTDNLIEAAASSGCRRFVAQSVAWAVPPGKGADAVAHLENATLAFGGVVLRYGQFYGPGTFYPDVLPDEPRVHVDTAARLTVAALDAPCGVITVVDDEATSG